MFKFTFDKSSLDFSDIIDGLRDRLNAAFGAAVAEMEIEGRKLADQRLKGASAKANWNRGYKIEKIDDNNYIIAIEGMLSNWMEQGIDVGEVSKTILSGNRAEINASEGKKYVDVPIAKDADQAGNIALGKSGAGINVQAFKDSDAVMQYITSSDWKKGGAKKRQVSTKRVESIIQNIESNSGSVKHSYLTIRRLSENSKPWPQNPFKGANVLPDLGLYLDQNIDRILSRYL